jgi:hypothetical protein
MHSFLAPLVLPLALTATASAQCLGWRPLNTAGYGGGGQYALAAHDDGGGTALHVGGFFASFAGLACDARFDGSVWSAPAIETPFPGAFTVVTCMRELDLGGGPELFAGGTSLWRWTSGAWVRLGAPPSSTMIVALDAFDAGAGRKLVAALGPGFPQLGAGTVATFDAGTWTPLHPALAGVFSALCAFDDGAGSAIECPPR